jgi:20S proteasome subunit beta 7
METAGPKTLTQQPTTVGTSVVALKYKDGVVLAYNNALSQYGMHLFDKVQRHFVVDDRIVFSASGEFSDYQEICMKVDKLNRTSRINSDKHLYKPGDYAKFISSLCYEQRNKADPLYIEGVLAGVSKKGESFLGYIDLYGTYLQQDYITTGFSRHLCGHIINSSWNKDCDLQTALNVLEQCFKALFVKHCPAREDMAVVVIDKDGIKTDVKKVQATWNYPIFIEKESIIKGLLTF